MRGTPSTGVAVTSRHGPVGRSGGSAPPRRARQGVSGVRLQARAAGAHVIAVGHRKRVKTRKPIAPSATISCHIDGPLTGNGSSTIGIAQAALSRGREIASGHERRARSNGARRSASRAG